MLTGIRKSDNKKVIGDKIAKDINESYLCDFCGNELIHHKSEIKIKVGHFKHKSGQSDCANNIKETEWHINTKLDIYNYISSNWIKNLKTIGIEVWLYNKKIRADIYLETNKGSKIAIEVQASILQVTEIKRRTENYNKAGIYVMWIIPYEYERFNELKQTYEWENGQRKLLTEQWQYKEYVRLKEYELFLYRCYYKKIFAWDLTHKHSNDFILLNLDDYTTMVNTFYKDGEEMTVGGNKTKTTKEIKSIYPKIAFNNLTTYNAPEFEVKSKNYKIPERKIFTYYEKQK